MPQQQPAGLIPHLVMDNASGAIEFYKKALGATEKSRSPAQDGKRVMHAEIELNGASVYLSDDFPEFCGGKSRTPKAYGGSPITLHLNVANCDATVARAVEHGAKCTMGPMDAFWGMRYAQITDPFGHQWAIAHPIPPTAPPPGMGGPK
jgi:PhnB protein